MTPPEPATNRQPPAGTWPLIHAERAALAADLAELTGQQWATRSCSTRSPAPKRLPPPTPGPTPTPGRGPPAGTPSRSTSTHKAPTRPPDRTAPPPPAT